MEYTIGETKFRHKMWGEGILLDIKGPVICIDFPQVGLKKLTEASLQNGLLTVVEPENPVDKDSETASSYNGGTLVQYDTSDTVIGGKNILEAFQSDDVVVFNESYTIVGNETKAKKISATYDLTIVGNISIDEIQVNGNLTIIGNIAASVISCANALVCQGDVKAEQLFVGSIIAKSINCSKFVCDGNALIETTIDIDESSRTEKTMVACEGIIGSGSFAAANAIANEYFEFTGDIQGKVLELDAQKTLSELTAPIKATADLTELPIEEVIRRVEERLQLEFKQCESMDEEALIDLTQSLEDDTIHNLADSNRLFNALISISYQDEIDDFGDYLTVVFAKKVLPEALYRYETIEHIDEMMLPKAEKELYSLDFKPKSVEHIANCIQIAIRCTDAIPMQLDDVLDKIFSSFGIRYPTVRDILKKSSTSSETIAD